MARLRRFRQMRVDLRLPKIECSRLRDPKEMTADVGNDEQGGAEAEQVAQRYLAQLSIALGRDDLVRLVPHLGQRSADDLPAEASLRYGVSAREQGSASAATTEAAK